MSKKRVYRGQLVTTSNGEDDTLLGLMESAGKAPKIVAEMLYDDLRAHGQYLSVRYFITDSPVAEDKLEEALVAYLIGAGDFGYRMYYSEATGYLWTDEDLMVGGHDLLAELKSNLGKYVHLEIEYAK